MQLLSLETDMHLNDAIQAYFLFRYRDIYATLTKVLHVAPLPVIGASGLADGA